MTQQAVCTAAQVQAAVNACFGPPGSMATCEAWETANPSCAACALGYEPDGGVSSDSAIYCFPGLGCTVNTDACVQITDGNDTCATADFELSYCMCAACDSASCVADLMEGNGAAQTAYNDCLNAAAGLACSTQNTTWNTACVGNDSADGGSIDRCTAMTALEVVRILTLICDANNQ